MRRPRYFPWSQSRPIQWPLLPLRTDIMRSTLRCLAEFGLEPGEIAQDFLLTARREPHPTTFRGWVGAEFSLELFWHRVLGAIAIVVVKLDTEPHKIANFGLRFPAHLAMKIKVEIAIPAWHHVGPPLSPVFAIDPQQNRHGFSPVRHERRGLPCLNQNVRVDALYLDCAGYSECIAHLLLCCTEANCKSKVTSTLA